MIQSWPDLLSCACRSRRTCAAGAAPHGAFPSLSGGRQALSAARRHAPAVFLLSRSQTLCFVSVIQSWPDLLSCACRSQRTCAAGAAPHGAFPSLSGGRQGGTVVHQV